MTSLWCLHETWDHDCWLLLSGSYQLEIPGSSPWSLMTGKTCGDPVVWTIFFRLVLEWKWTSRLHYEFLSVADMSCQPPYWSEFPEVRDFGYPWSWSLVPHTGRVLLQQDPKASRYDTLFTIRDHLICLCMLIFKKFKNYVLGIPWQKRETLKLWPKFAVLKVILIWHKGHFLSSEIQKAWICHPQKCHMISGYCDCVEKLGEGGGQKYTITSRL